MRYHEIMEITRTVIVISLLNFLMNTKGEAFIYIKVV